MNKERASLPHNERGTVLKSFLLPLGEGGAKRRVRVEITTWLPCASDGVDEVGFPVLYDLNTPLNRGRQLSRIFDRPFGRNTESLGDLPVIDVGTRDLSTHAHGRQAAAIADKRYALRVHQVLVRGGGVHHDREARNPG